MKRSFKTALFYFLFFAVAASQLTDCTSHKREFDEAEKLAKQYCQSCHLFPQPNTLDKDTWVYSVLPAMGPRLGIRAANGIIYKYNAPKGSLPDSAALSQSDWDKIVLYYYSLAPSKLNTATKEISNNLQQFNYLEPSYRNGSPPVTTLVKIDPQAHSIYVCDGSANKIRVFNRKLNFVSEASTHKAVSSIALDTFKNNQREATLLDMGILNPNDVVSGKMQRLRVTEDLKASVTDIPDIDSLMRPVFLEHKDIDNDGRKDFLVCEFGNFYGELAWLKTHKDGTFQKRKLNNRPGAMQTRFIDYNNDGREDIMALMAQGDEGLLLYSNNANGVFEEKTLLRFPSVNGSTSFDLADFNADGYLDIVYTAGDNSDYSKILKPYHGVYIFMNDGKWNFGKADYFFPINGSFKAIARDFDQDGDVDLATISFFADLKTTPQEGFVYLRNDGDLKFYPQTFPQVMVGHWLTIDAGDLDGDGDLDIVLGNMSVGPLNINVENKWPAGPPFVLLENKLK